ncbi:MAG TPA: lipoyl(octanoyl) transferase LipB [Bacillota bacterium]
MAPGRDPAAVTGTLAVADLGRRRPYGPVWALQRALVERRLAGRVDDLFLLVEHEPVYTLGRHGKADNVIWDERRRRREGIELYRIDRGGDVTYHGPGQVVGYPILDLRPLGLGVRAYVERLEAGLIAACADFGVKAEVFDGLPGVWVGDAKIAAIGIRCRGGVTSHGFALNVSTDLSHFGGIVPCGLAGRGVTSLERELGRSPDWDEVIRVVARRVAEALGFPGVRWVPADEVTAAAGSAPEQVAQ